METRKPRAVVQEFLRVVRSGDAPERAGEFMAPMVTAHQVQSENAESVERTPEDYAEHVRSMLAMYGNFRFRVDEVIAEDDKVYARWTQHGRHVGVIDGAPPTNAPLVEVASCVYRVLDERIVEYWIQIDRAGLIFQLES